jgi:ankyrin repeat protein
MNLGRIARLSALLLGLSGAVAAAPKAGLADAAEDGDGAAVRSLIDRGADVNAPQADGTTALHWAAYHDDAELAALLVRSDANVNAENRYGVPPLSLSCTNGNGPLVKLLLDAGANANAARQGGETVLMTAARTGSLDAVEALLAHGADPNALERNGQSAVIWASAEGHAAVVEALIEAGADFSLTLKSGFNPMFFAVREGRTDVVRTLLRAGTDVNEALHRKGRPIYQHARTGTSPLLLAIENGHFDLAAALLEAGAGPNDERTGFTPLHTISWVRKPEVSDSGSDPVPEGSGNLSSLQFVRTLVAMGADVNARLENGKSQAPRINVKGATPFLFAADKADVPLMKLLLELGADPFLPNVEGTTPLMAAAGLGTTAPLEEAGTEAEALEATKLLLELGADINAVDDNGETVMHGAAYGSFPTVVQLLAEKQADPEIWKQPNKHGWTPLFIAEGYRPRNFKPAPATIEAVQRIMAAENISTAGPRPRHIGAYEKARLAAQKKP